ncbi:hypothetical protein [Abyssisolibacter fermentans]|uniref:hypothetical protein n=1 Tax=Abyssisolibacter fermentans TaxID=1766203 RepID=UPI0008322843|nr:hypothetical protein [Abyssisolibacter fermentans]
MHKYQYTDTLKEEINLIWEKVQIEDNSHLERINLRDEKNEIFLECKMFLDKELYLWSYIFDISIEFMYLLHKKSFECFNYDKENQSPAFSLICGKLTSLLLGIKELLSIGHEDNARLLSRTFLECVDIALVSLYDEAFEDFIVPGDEICSKEFWKKKIAYGKINNKIRQVINIAGIDDVEMKYYLSQRKKVKSILSDSVHLSSSTIFRSNLIPSIKYKGKLSVNLLGHISTHTPQHMMYIIDEVFHFGSIIIKLIMSKKSPKLFSQFTEIENSKDLFVYFLFLQELVVKYGDCLSKDFVHEFNELVP